MKQGQGKFTYHNGDVFSVSMMIDYAQYDDRLIDYAQSKMLIENSKCMVDANSGAWIRKELPRKL